MPKTHPDDREQPYVDPVALRCPLCEHELTALKQPDIGSYEIPAHGECAPFRVTEDQRQRISSFASTEWREREQQRVRAANALGITPTVVYR